MPLAVYTARAVFFPIPRQRRAVRRNSPVYLPLDFLTGFRHDDAYGHIFDIGAPARWPLVVDDCVSVVLLDIVSIHRLPLLSFALLIPACLLCF